MERFEYQAYMPPDPHDSWVRGGMTKWQSKVELRNYLEHYQSLPGGLKGVVIYKRPISKSVKVNLSEVMEEI